MPDVTEKDIERANSLMQILHDRLDQHVRNRVAYCRQGHWCLTLARSNIGTMAAILVRKMHCKKKICEHIPRDRWEECLLTRSTTKFIQAIGASRMLEGCYLYHHRNSKVADEDADDDTAFVRSGKAASGHTTRNIGVRYQDAQACAQLLPDNPT